MARSSNSRIRIMVRSIRVRSTLSSVMPSPPERSIDQTLRVPARQGNDTLCAYHRTRAQPGHDDEPDGDPHHLAHAPHEPEGDGEGRGEAEGPEQRDVAALQ